MASSSALSPEWIEKYETFNKHRTEGFKLVDKGITMEHENKYREAIACYEAGLEIIDKALNIYLENVPHSFWDQYYENVKKMKVTRKDILSRLTDLQNPDIVGNSETPFDPSAPSVSQRNAPPSYDEAMSNTSSGAATPTSPYSTLSSTLDKMSMVAEGTVIYVQENVRMYFISPDGHVSSLSSPSTLNIAQYKDGTPGNEDIPRYYMQIGDWIYPLLPGLSPVLHSEFRSFIIPDVHSTVEGSAVGLVMPEETDHFVYEILEDILQDILQRSPKIQVKTPPPRPPLPQIEAATKPVEETSWTRRISQGIVVGAEYVAYGLVKGAEKAGELLNSTTPKVIAQIQPDPEPHSVSPNVKKGMKVAKDVTGTAVQVTGYIAGKIGSATMALGRMMAPHIQTQGTKLLSRVSGLSEQEASGKMEGALEVTAGAVQGVGTVYTALENAASILAKNIANNTVQIVQHKYGHSAGEVAGDTLYTVGNTAVAGYTASSLTTKGIAKRAAKNAGKAVLEDYTFKDPKNPSAEDDGAGPSKDDSSAYKNEKPPL